MIKHGIAESNTKPDSIKLDEYSVWEATNITELEMDGEKIYNYELNQYPKDEYILMKLSENQLVTDIAMMELAELILGGI